MRAVQPVTSEVRYVLGLFHAGMDGLISAQKANEARHVMWGSAWMPAAVGAAVGATTASLGGSRRSGYGVARGALFGSVLGFGCGMAWASRNFTLELARGARRHIDAARDVRWLENHPIDYA